MRYSIELEHESGTNESLPLIAKNDQQAEAELKNWLKANTIPEDCHVYLAFYRACDGQHGYLNPDGASPTGKPWNPQI
jgi:hypothetical protein